MTLIEVVAALGLMAFSGVALLSLSSSSIVAVGRARDHEAALVRADGFLGAISIWRRVDLDRRLGKRREGPWVLTIQRPSLRLYQIELADSLGNALLRTTLYRDEEPR